MALLDLHVLFPPFGCIPGKIEGLERSRSEAGRAAAAASAAAAAAAARPLVSAEKVESIAEDVQKLVSGAGAMGRRQATLENRRAY